MVIQPMNIPHPTGPRTICQMPLSHRPPILLTLGGFFLLANSFLANAAAQVSDSELNSLAREAAANRNATALGDSIPTVGIDFLTLLIKGGIFMIPIGIVSLMVVTFVVDRFVCLRAGRLVPGRLRKSLVQLVRQGDIDPPELYRTSVESKSALGNVVSAIAVRAGRPQPELQAVAQEATQREVDKAYANVRWLNLAAGIAPLLGLLGTVWGLIRAFHDTTQLTAGQNRADFLAVGIYEALVTTLAGLMVAIPAAVASHYFEGRITRLFRGLEELTMDLIPRLEHVEGKVRFDAIGRDLVLKNISGRSPSVGNTSSANIISPPVQITQTGTSQAPHRGLAAKSEAKTR